MPCKVHFHISTCDLPKIDTGGKGRDAGVRPLEGQEAGEEEFAEGGEELGGVGLCTCLFVRVCWMHTHKRSSIRLSVHPSVHSHLPIP